jgi:hypothetical protein
MGYPAHSTQQSYVVLTPHTGSDSDLLPHILGLYASQGSMVADVTYGKRAFGTKTDTTKYDQQSTDLLTGVDSRDLPYKSASVDWLVLDPPYMHGGPTIEVILNDCYHNASTGHESGIRLYGGGLLEAARVLRQKGICIVKCQDKNESVKQCLSPVDLIQFLTMLGFADIDPITAQTPQKSAPRNHFCALVARFRR